jgi:NAD(P)-dependent dehydrogenase (short-subunit alcohol dehydrogenase family)
MSGPGPQEFALDLSVRDLVVVVTGAAQGIGQGVAVAMAHQGADVALLDINESGLARTASLIAITGRRALQMAVDVGDRGSVIDAVAHAVKELGPVAGLVNCAAVICENAPAQQAAEADLDRLWRVNVKGGIWAAQAVFESMRDRGGGAIVNIASQAAILALPHQLAYTATKGAVAAMTRSLAIDWAPQRIRVNALAPTFVRTPMAEPMLQVPEVYEASVRRIPLGRIGHVRDVAAAAVFLCSPAASLITGQLIAVDGGWSAGEPGLLR